MFIYSSSLANTPLSAAPVVERSPKEIADDLAKLELVRRRRAEQAAARIAAEGYDRFAPVAPKTT